MLLRASEEFSTTRMRRVLRRTSSVWRIRVELISVLSPKWELVDSAKVKADGRSGTRTTTWKYCGPSRKPTFLKRIILKLRRNLPTQINSDRIPDSSAFSENEQSSGPVISPSSEEHNDEFTPAFPVRSFCTHLFG
jgi:hypothetical protein